MLKQRQVYYQSGKLVCKYHKGGLVICRKENARTYTLSVKLKSHICQISEVDRATSPLLTARNGWAENTSSEILDW